MTRKKNSYQRGSVELHHGVWTLRFREFNHATQKWTTKRRRLGKFKDKKAARRAADTLMLEINRDNNNPNALPSRSRLTFGQFIESRWPAYRVRAKHKRSTIAVHTSVFNNHLLPVFGDKFLGEISPGDISDFLATLAEYAGNTRQQIYGLLRLLFDLAQQLDLITTSPVRSKLHQPEVKRVDKPTLTPEQVRAVIENLPREDRRSAILIAVTGLRLNECLALRWCDFDEDSRKLTVNHTLYRGQLEAPKTESSKRCLRLPDKVARQLVEQRQASNFQAETDFIFCRPDGRPIHGNLFRLRLYAAMDLCGIERVKGKHGFHIFRHTAGTLLYWRSRDLKLVQGTLGHADISTTSDIYVHVDDELIGEGAEILADVILGNCDLSVTQEVRLVS